MARQGHGAVFVSLPDTTKCLHRRDTRESFLEALNPASFVINGHDQRWGPQAMNVGRERGQLIHRFEVAAEKDHATGLRMGQARTLFRRKRRAAHIDHHSSLHRLQCHVTSFSRTTNAIA